MAVFGSSSYCMDILFVGNRVDSVFAVAVSVLARRGTQQACDGETLLGCFVLIVTQRSNMTMPVTADEDATVRIDDKLLGRKIDKMLHDGFAKRIGGGEFTGTEGGRIFVLMW